MAKPGLPPLRSLRRIRAVALLPTHRDRTEPEPVPAPAPVPAVLKPITICDRLPETAEVGDVVLVRHGRLYRYEQDRGWTPVLRDTMIETATISAGQITASQITPGSITHRVISIDDQIVASLEELTARTATLDDAVDRLGTSITEFRMEVERSWIGRSAFWINDRLVAFYKWWFSVWQR